MIKFTGSDSQWFIRSRARPEIRPSEEVHSEILSWGTHLLKKISFWAFLLVAIERNDLRKLEQCALVGKRMLLPLIFCSWMWWNSFWGYYEKAFLLPSALCHATCELISPCNLTSWLIHLWYLSHSACGFEMFPLSTLEHDGQEMCMCMSTCALGGIWKTENLGKALMSKSLMNFKLWNHRKPQCRLEICSWGCPEQQGKVSINHIVSLIFCPSSGFFKPPPPPYFMIPVLSSSWWW